MPHDPLHFVVTDPRLADGNPYEVAERAVIQAAAVARILQQTTQTARIMARNAELDRQLLLEGNCDPQKFEDSVVAKKIDKVVEDAQDALKQLEIVAKAASFNPKARIGR